ncbi:MAG: helix-hairpin-helix domain-containing protein [Bacteroidetes bacterium]|nr:helix-hairpin-helix domain-containing protein [Bacteroidota bacterium]
MKTNRFRHFLYSYFTYTRGEKNAALVLCSILIVLQASLWYQHYYLAPEILVPSVEVNLAADKIHLKEKEKNTYSNNYKKREEIKLTVFDPNTADSSQLVALGMSPKQSSSLIRFRERIGGFKSKEDVKNVRVLHASLFEKWDPFIELSPAKGIKSTEKFNSGFKSNSEASRPKWIVLDLNEVDTTELQDLPFIGSGRSKAIVSYRERLGGFYTTEQLKEIRSIPDSVYKIIFPKVKVEGGPYKKLNINSLPADSLKHPYINKQLARLIVAYREQHGVFKSLADLKKIPLVDEEILRKLAPYLLLN